MYDFKSLSNRALLVVPSIPTLEDLDSLPSHHVIEGNFMYSGCESFTVEFERNNFENEITVSLEWECLGGESDGDDLLPMHDIATTYFGNDLYNTSLKIENGVAEVCFEHLLDTLKFVFVDMNLPYNSDISSGSEDDSDDSQSYPRGW